MNEVQQFDYLLKYPKKLNFFSRSSFSTSNIQYIIFHMLNYIFAYVFYHTASLFLS
jgi:hypothetical protein